MPTEGRQGLNNQQDLLSNKGKPLNIDPWNMKHQLSAI